jgi:prophage maintenance system killer protein
VTRYPTVEETIAVHAILIARFGGSTGIRDRAALESALARPRSGYYSDVIQEAAALWESLSQNHAFVDGDSAPIRTGFRGESEHDSGLKANRIPAGSRTSIPV